METYEIMGDAGKIGEYTYLPDRVDVLDKGYVRLTGSMGSELDIVNAARVSFEKESTGKYITDSDARLIRFLKREGHWSPFRHVHVGLEFYAPLMVARQAYKHVVGAATLEEGSSWNESSRRYVTEIPTFYVPEEWRRAPENKKQGSGDRLDLEVERQLTFDLIEYIDKSMEYYDKAVAAGVCTEQARLFLPSYGMYVRWRWTPSLDAVMHFLNLRLDSHAQREIQEYAEALLELVQPRFPTVFEAI
jgi:thymidylate synthase (FAD)